MFHSGPRAIATLRLETVLSSSSAKTQRAETRKNTIKKAIFFAVNCL
jgi:hypothetical protein